MLIFKGYLQGKWVAQMLILKRKKKSDFFQNKIKYSQLPPLTWHDFSDLVAVPRGQLMATSACWSGKLTGVGNWQTLDNFKGILKFCKIQLVYKGKYWLSQKKKPVINILRFVNVYEVTWFLIRSIK